MNLNHGRLYAQALGRAQAEWGLATWRKLGTRFPRALIAEEVLLIAAGQDKDHVSAETVRAFVEYGFSRLFEEE